MYRAFVKKTVMPISVDRVNDLLKKQKFPWFVFLLKKILNLSKPDFRLRIEREKSSLVFAKRNAKTPYTISLTRKSFHILNIYT